MGYGSYSALGKLSVFLFFGMVAFGINIGKTYPTAVFIGSLLLALLGMPAWVYSLTTVQKYKNVFDFEPTTFLGKQRNGKYVREIMMTLAWVSFWLAIAGIALLIIRR